MDAWRSAVIQEVQKWLRTPWHHRAKVLGVGVDCAQLLIAAYAGAGIIEDFDTGEYPPDLMLHSEQELFTEWIERYMNPIESPEPGDAVLWKFGRSFSHAAIVVAWPNFIHAYRAEGCVCYGDDRDVYLNRRAKHFYTPKVIP